MNKTLLFLAAIGLALTACKQDPKGSANAPAAQPSANAESLAGHWIAMDFCSRAGQYGSVLAAMNNAHIPYAYGLTFDPAKPDSVMCFNGLEQYALPVSIRVDTVEIKGASQGKSVFLVYDSQGSKNITMFDGTRDKTHLDAFIKSKGGSKDGYLAFLLALNHQLFSGRFTSLRKGAATADVVFTPGGWLQNLKDYDRYEVCTAGDCFVTGDEIDVVTLSNSKQADSDKMFGFRYSAQNDTLSIYNLINQNPDEKSAYKIGSLAYQFLRTNAE